MGTMTMENFNNSGNDRRETEDRRDYGSRTSRSETGKRPRIKRSFSTPARSRVQYGEDTDRPRRSYGEANSRSFSERPHRTTSYGDERPHRSSYGEDRPRRTSYGDSDRSFPERPRRSSFGDPERNFTERPRRASYGDERPHRTSYGEERPRRTSYGDSDRSFPERPRRSSFGDPERSFTERPRRASYGDERPRRTSYGEERQRRPTDGRNFQNRKKSFKSRPVADNKASNEGINRMIDRKASFDEAFVESDMVNIPVKEVVRLNKFIANSGVCSRREADNFIQAGVVTVNGEVVTELGSKVNIYTDDVRFNGERLKGEEKVYIVMNKPKGYVTTASDPHAEKTVMDLLKGCTARVFPVGRLDKNTTGVLMFTNDGEIAEKLTHPSYDKKKIYQVTLSESLKQEDYDQIKAGVVLTDGEIAADELEYIDENDHRKLGIEIHSGKNRIVRRIFESLGYDVKALDRVYFAGLTKKGIKRGGWRFLSEGEINILKMGAYR